MRVTRALCWITTLDVIGPTPVFDRGAPRLRTKVSVALEELHGALVFLRRCARLEGAEVAALAAFRIFLARVEAVLARRQFSNHRLPPFLIGS